MDESILSEVMSVPLLTFPLEILYEIGRLLPVRSLLRLIQVSHECHSLFTQSRFWQDLYHRDLSALRPPPDPDYYRSYGQVYRDIRRLPPKDRLVQAAERGYEKLVQTALILTSPVHPEAIDNQARRRALAVAARYNYPDIIDLFQSDKYRDVILLNASQYGHLNLVRKVISQGVAELDLDEALEDATACGHRNIVEYLIQ